MRLINSESVDAYKLILVIKQLILFHNQRTIHTAAKVLFVGRHVTKKTYIFSFPVVIVDLNIALCAYLGLSYFCVLVTCVQRSFGRILGQHTGVVQGDKLFLLHIV